MDRVPSRKNINTPSRFMMGILRWTSTPVMLLVASCCIHFELSKYYCYNYRVAGEGDISFQFSLTQEGNNWGVSIVGPKHLLCPQHLCLLNSGNLYEQIPHVQFNFNLLLHTKLLQYQPLDTLVGSSAYIPKALRNPWPQKSGVASW